MTIIKYIGICNKVIIPDTIWGRVVTSIGKGAFRDCTSPRSVTIPDSVTSIGEMATSGCNSLKSIIFGNGTKNYDSMDGAIFNKY